MPPTDTPRIVIFGATGRVGQLLVHEIHGKGFQVLGVGRRRALLDSLPCEPVILDLKTAAAAAPVARAADIVINAAHARYTQAIARLCDPAIARYVVIGSTRYLTRFPDRKANEVRQAADFLRSAKVPWVLLHPTMIYGARGENNVQRMAALIRRFHVVPLPNAGAALVQPVHVDDVVAAVVNAALLKGVNGKTIHLAGPVPVSFRTFLQAIAAAAGTWVKVVSLPVPMLKMIAAMTRMVPGIPSITDAEVQRLLEDKAVDASEMKALLKVTPRPLSEGLTETFGAKSKS